MNNNDNGKLFISSQRESGKLGLYLYIQLKRQCRASFSEGITCEIQACSCPDFSPWFWTHLFNFEFFFDESFLQMARAFEYIKVIYINIYIYKQN